MADLSACHLVADIGGTNARFAMVEPGSLEPMFVRNLACADFDSPEAAVAHYLHELLELDTAPPAVCLAVATPVWGDSLRMTNCPWTIDRKSLNAALGDRQLLLINDFAAQAHAVIELSADQRLLVGGEARQSEAPVTIVGPGTGLGVAGIRWHNGAVQVHESEAGHIGFAPSNEREVEVLRYLRRRFDRVSVERVLSGPGLVNLYRAMAAIRGEDARDLKPAEVTERAVGGTCQLCVDALDSFCAILGGFAGDMALTMVARGGLYLAGGIVGRFPDYLRNSAFNQRFADKGRFAGWTAEIPRYLIDIEQPGLRGAAAALMHA